MGVLVVREPRHENRPGADFFRRAHTFRDLHLRDAFRAEVTHAGPELITALLLLYGFAGAVVLLIVWGLAYGAVPVCSQTWFAQTAPQAPEAASVLFTSSFQAPALRKPLPGNG
jgi:hypothetical protein